MAKQTLQFETEAKQILDLMIHSLYSNKDIFLRELISNSSDALDKLRFESIAQPDLLKGEGDLGIHVELNKEASTITINDNGIGMNKDDLIKNIGTIAHSGTGDFLKNFKKAKETDIPELIGQFGVGFYSSFMVADKVSIVTKKAGDDTAWAWESTGDGEYSISEATRESQGTTITLHLKEVEDEGTDYTQEWSAKQIIKKYSDFVTYPITMDVEKTTPAEEEGEEPTTEVVTETINSMKAIWRRADEDVTEDDHKEFYSHISHDWNPPSHHFSIHAEGTTEWRSLLYFPQKAPYDMFNRESKTGLQLFVKQVFIMDNCEALLPEYFRFVRGVVDSRDLPLNVSRELLQENRLINQIRKRLLKKIFSELATMLDKDREKYVELWNEFGKVMKEGLGSDQDNREKLLGLMMAPSTLHESKLTSIDEYIGRMGEEQKNIYFITGDSRVAMEKSPHLEAFRKKNIEVLFLTDPVDELVITEYLEYKEKVFHSVVKGDADELTTEEEKKAVEDKKEDFALLLTSMQVVLDKHIKEVRLSSRLTDSASCLVGEKHDISPQLEQMLKQANQPVPDQKRILELNPDHVLMGKMLTKHTDNNEDQAIGDYAQLLYGQALLAEGSPLPDAVEFNRVLTSIMESHLA